MSWLRTAMIDEYVEDGRSAVMLEDGRVLALTEIPTEILRLVGVDGADLATITRGLVHTFGEPDRNEFQPDIESIVLVLEREGLLRQGGS